MWGMIAGMGIQAAGMWEQNRAAEYNAAVNKEAGRAEAESINAEARRLAGEQREIAAQQRVDLAASGAGAGQEQPLMLLAAEANKMHLDQLELRRQAEIAKDFGTQQSLIAKLQGRSQAISNASQLVMQGYDAYQSWKAGRGSDTPSSTPQTNIQTGYGAWQA